MNQKKSISSNKQINIKQDNNRHLINNKQQDQLALSTIITNPQHHQQQNQQTLQKLITINQNYLMNKVKVSDVVKPSPYSYKIPSKTGNSQYNRKYASIKKTLPIDQSQSNPKRNISGSLTKLSNSPIAGYLSTYHFDYDKKKKNSEDNIFKLQKKTKKKYEKDDGPTFNQSSYNRDFIAVQCSPQQSAKRKEIKLMGGGKFNSDTTYQHTFYDKLKEIGQNSKPIIHKDHEIFVKVNNNQKSSYQDSYASKTKTKKQPSCKPIHQYKSTKNKMKYKTQYTQTFVQQKMGKKIDFNCLTNEQLKRYVMTILQD